MTAVERCAVAHVVGASAVALGDPAVIVTCDDGAGDAEPWVLEVFRWLPGPGPVLRPQGQWLVVNGHDDGRLDLDEVLRAAGWRRLSSAEWRYVDVGYHLAPVERHPAALAEN